MKHSPKVIKVSEAKEYDVWQCQECKAAASKPIVQHEEGCSMFGSQLDAKPATAKIAENEHTDVTLLRDIVQAFTRHHARLHIELEKPGTILMQAHRDDHPRITGAVGRNIEAIRSIFRFIAAARKEKLVILLAEPEHGQRQDLQPFEKNPDWKPDGVIELMTRILNKVLRAPFTIEQSSSEAKSTTLLEIKAAKEDERIVDAIQPALHTIFHAIGKSQGRSLYVELDQNEAAVFS